MKQYIITDTTRGGTADLTPIFAGEHKCESGYTYGPFARDCYLIHFCISGCGTLTDRHGTHAVSAGELFVIRPEEVTVYSADRVHPWDYRWVGFVGRDAEKFDTGCSVYKIPAGIAERISEAVELEELSPEIYKSIIYELIYRLFTASVEDVDTHGKLHKIRKYIRFNYMEPLRVSEIARSFGFERSYLSRIFKRRYGVGIKEYITEVRLDNARTFLERGYNVSESAHLVGYEDEFNFSKAFKRRFGVSPSALGIKNKARPLDSEQKSSF